MNDVVVLFQLRRGKVAGDDAGGGGLRSSSGSPFCCGKKPYDASRACSREREERKDWGEEMRASHRVGIGDIRRLYRGAPASNLVALAVSRARIGKGVGGGGPGPFIGAGMR
jgi:hypothetical protein